MWGSPANSDRNVAANTTGYKVHKLRLQLLMCITPDRNLCNNNRSHFKVA